MTMDKFLEGKILSYQHHPNGTTYVYEVLERYWDKDKQQARNKQVCIGKLDPMTGSFIPSRRFSEQELATVREWLHGKAWSIFGGSDEVTRRRIGNQALGMIRRAPRGSEQ